MTRTPPRRPLGTRRATTAIIILGAALAVPAHAARAQPYLGDTVRLSIRELETRRGSFVRADSAAVYLRVVGDSGVIRTPYGDFTRADALSGHVRAGSRAVGIGAAIGAGLGAVLGIASISMHPGHGGTAISGTGVLVGSVLGAALGTVVGTASSGMEREAWQPVDLQRLASPAPVAAATQRDVAVAMAVAATPDTVPRTTPTSPREATTRPVRDSGMASVGDTVRLYQGRVELVRGVLAGIDSADFLVVPMSQAGTARFARAGLTRAEVRRGDRRRGMSAMGKGAVIGVGIGAAFVTLSIVAHDKRNEGMDILLGIFLGAASSIIGTAAGGVAALTYTDMWMPFDPMTLRVTQVAR